MVKTHQAEIGNWKIGNVEWYRRRDSNPHCLVPKTSASSRLGYAGLSLPIVNCRLPICLWRQHSSDDEDQSEIGNRQSAMLWWTWHDLNVRPRPSQSRALIPLSYRSETLAEAAGLEPAHAKRGDLANRCHTVRRRLQVVNWRKGQESNLQATSAVVFGTTALPVRLPFQRRISDCEFRIADLCRTARMIARFQFEIRNSQSEILLGAC